MSRSAMVGLALIVIGAAIYLRGLGFTSKREVLKIGDVSVSAEEQSPIAPWVAGLAVLAGIALMTTGARRKA
ncbi:MAG TPA: hypothetical protein VNM36_01210 [Gemmatimonadaceae bacterium]|nr:hypothetical protein [Gemmatimonadaceae bacterium]